MSLDYAKYVAGLIEKARAAQAIAENFTQERVDQLTGAVAYALTQPDVALRFGEQLVAESGMGVAKDKQAKMFAKVKGTYFQMKGKNQLGLWKLTKRWAWRNMLDLWCHRCHYACNQWRSNSRR